jgi:hypothetical protein
MRDARKGIIVTGMTKKQMNMIGVPVRVAVDIIGRIVRHAMLMPRR